MMKSTFIRMRTAFFCFASLPVANRKLSVFQCVPGALGVLTKHRPGAPGQA